MSLSLCLSLCGVVVVLLWWVVVWCVVCVVCDTLKTPCMPAPRAHVFSTCTRGAGIHGDVFFCVLGGWTRREGKGSSTASCFSSVKPVIFFENFMSTLTAR